MAENLKGTIEPNVLSSVELKPLHKDTKIVLGKYLFSRKSFIFVLYWVMVGISQVASNNGVWDLTYAVKQKTDKNNILFNNKNKYDKKL